MHAVNFNGYWFSWNFALTSFLSTVFQKKKKKKPTPKVYLCHNANVGRCSRLLHFSRKENLKKCTSFEEQKGTRYIRGNVYFGIIVFSCLSSTKPCLRFLLICFAREMKGFYQSPSGNEVDFWDIMNVSPNIFAKS